MTTKAEYRERFERHPRPNQETQKVINYFGNDDKFWYINSSVSKAFLSQSELFMCELVLENDGNLDRILAKTRETLEPLCPPNLADFDSVDWHYVGLDFFWGELFDYVGLDSFED